MTKFKKALSYDPRQPGLFDIVKQTALHTITPQGSLAIMPEIKLALSEDLRHAIDENGRELSRAQVAARMTDLIGEEITSSMLYNWTSPAHPHEMHISYFPAFVRATGGQRRAAEALSRHCGLFILPGAEALRAEIQQINETIHKMQAEKQKRRLFLRELEGK
jgi:hypothetical protein